MLGSLTPPFPLRVIVQDHSGQAAARNRGAEDARGRYLLFLDDDVVVEKRLVAAHLDALRSSDHLVGIGRIVKGAASRALRGAGLGRVRRSGGTITTASPPAASRGSATPMAGTCPYGGDDFLEV